MTKKATEDSDFVYFESDFQQNEKQITFKFPNGSIILNGNDVISEGKNHQIRKGAEISPNSIADFRECNCQIKIPPTGKVEKISKHGCDTTCFGVVMVCHYCVYNEAGVFISEKSEVCGVCVGLPF